MPTTREPRTDAPAEPPTIRRTTTVPGGPLLGPGATFPPPPGYAPDQGPDDGSEHEGERPRLSQVQRRALIAAVAGAVAGAVTIPFLVSDGSPARAQPLPAASQTYASPPSAASPPTAQSLAPGVFGSATPSPGPSRPQASQSPGPSQPQAPRSPSSYPSPRTTVTRPSVRLPNPVGSWPLGGGLGTIDSAGTHDAVANNVSITPTQGAVFNGTSSSVTTSGPVLNTAAGASFTVAAWAYLTSTKGFATAVSQDGKVNSGFYLQYSVLDKRWAFARVAHDTAGSPGIRALSTSAPVTKRWTHLVGVYNAATGMLFLYVDGKAQGTAKDTTPFASSGDLAIGRALFSSQQTDWFPGQIKDVKAFNQALTPTQAAAL